MTVNNETNFDSASTKTEFIASVFDLGRDFISDPDELPSRTHRRAFRKLLRIVTRDHFLSKPWSAYAGNAESQEALAMGLIDAAKQRAFAAAATRTNGSRRRMRPSVVTMHKRLSR